MVKTLPGIQYSLQKKIILTSAISILYIWAIPDISMVPHRTALKAKLNTIFISNHVTNPGELKWGLPKKGLFAVAQYGAANKAQITNS